jgi:hypothetical protein
MFGRKPKNKEEHRWYLLPGQGKGMRKKRRQQMIAALTVGVVCAAVLGAAIWLMNNRYL